MATVSVQPVHSEHAIPLIVDLDGTLIATDSLLESVLALIKHQPWWLLLMPFWVLRGKAALKSEIAKRVQLSADALPYRHDVIAYLRIERESGRTLVLATAAHHDIAYAVAAHLDLFSEVLATNGHTNSKGTAKRDALVKRFGVRGFDYIGDHRADVPVWAASRVAHVAGHRGKLAAMARKAGAQEGRRFGAEHPTIRTWLRAIRIQQWVKNVLIFAPLLLSHRLEPRAALPLLTAFFGFSFLASGTYVVNDLLDLAADRKHPSKRNRAFASGEISIGQGLVVAVLLIIVAFALGVVLGLRPLLYFLLYFAITVAYSGLLKSKPMVDVVALAFLYALRILVGGAAGDVRVSPWLFQFSVFLFLSLAFVKRYSELYRLQLEANGNGRARGYRLSDLTIISQAGIGSGLIAALVLAFYVNGPDVQRLYVQPHVLWAVCPIFIYWIMRVWLVAARGEMNEDPILFAFRDRISYMAGFAILIVMMLAMLPHVR